MNYSDYRKRIDKLNSLEHHFCLSFYSLLLAKGIDEDDISMGNGSISYRFSSITFIGRSFFNIGEKPFISKCTAYASHILKKEIFYLMNENELFSLVDLFISGDLVHGSRSVFDKSTQTFKRYLRREK